MKALDGLGLVKVVNRMDLLEDINNEDEDPVESDADVSDSSLSEEEWEFVESDTPMPSTLTIKDAQANRPTATHNPTPNPTSAAVEAPRSSRANKGQHSNFNRMPRSVVTMSQYVDQAMQMTVSQVNTGFVDMAQVMSSTLIEMMKVQKD